jgi:hypothetical protein
VDGDAFRRNVQRNGYERVRSVRASKGAVCDLGHAAGAILKGLGGDQEVEWHAAEAYVDALDAEARRTLLGILTSPSDIRAAAIGRLHARDDGAELTELLIELEEKEWARQWFVERLRQGG